MVNHPPREQWCAPFSCMPSTHRQPQEATTRLEHGMRTLLIRTPRCASELTASCSCIERRACWYSRLLSSSETPSRCWMYSAIIRTLFRLLRHCRHEDRGVRAGVPRRYVSETRDETSWRNVHNFAAVQQRHHLLHKRFRCLALCRNPRGAVLL